MSSSEKFYEMIRRLGYPERIAKAFGEVPREKFIFSEGVGAHSDSAVITYKDADVYSTSSQPSLMAEFMREVGLDEGMKVLEIGGGTGYNAAVMSKVVGKDGIVVSIEYEEKLYEKASMAKEDLSLDNVVFLKKDGYYGAEGYSPYDAIVVTVGVDEIPRFWMKQLRDKGRIIAPMNLKSVSMYQPAILFVKDSDFLKGTYRSATSFIKASGMLGNLNDRLLNMLKTGCTFSTSIKMSPSSMPILEIITASVGRTSGRFFFVEKNGMAIYDNDEWKACGDLRILKKAVKALEKANFPDILSCEFSFNFKRNDFLVKRLF